MVPAGAAGENPAFCHQSGFCFSCRDELHLGRAEASGLSSQRFTCLFLGDSVQVNIFP
jgi:hypothetical protein